MYMTTLEGPKSALTFNSNPLCEINGKNFGLEYRVAVGRGGAGLENKGVSWTMQSVVVLVAIFVLSFVAGFGWYTGGAAARVIARTLKRDSPRRPAKERAEAQPSRVKGHEADEPAV